MKRKRKSFLTYFIYSIFIVIIILFIAKGRQILGKWVSRHYKSLPLRIYDIIFPGFISFLIALPHLKTEKVRKGQWKFDWLKFLSIGIPSLYLGGFTLGFLLGPLSLTFSLPDFSEYVYRLWKYIYPFKLMSNGIGYFMSLSGIFVFVYIFLISLYKTEDSG